MSHDLTDEEKADFSNRFDAYYRKVDIGLECFNIIHSCKKMYKELNHLKDNKYDRMKGGYSNIKKILKSIDRGSQSVKDD